MMSQHFGAVVVLLSFSLGRYYSVSSIDVKDLKQSKCRFAGVDLVEYQDSAKKFNYTMAESACQALGLQLASKAQVEKAHGYGYETCNYGWVLEKHGVIPRIQNNKNCGQNKTGVLTWKVDLKQPFTAYCFNVSDTRINSCKPELMVTQPQSTVVMPTTGSNMASTALKTETPTVLKTETQTVLKTETQTVPSLPSRPPVKTTLLYTTLRTTVQPTRRDTTPMMTTDQTQKQENPMPQRNERVAFGGLPTTLLILALLFFIVAVVLAICYIKR
ncbi:hypothetical protein GDO78_019016 [Eleutherodactylus coqui]|uniref:Link domain-containing protein n=1 Tax=Eleutherodactylus coqui TaxID=57060 RepID=A0A8J6BJZ2_ELECQ|nr:hypothetical protein GDO78_019016 [Eleutherodactylus coqui]